MLWVIGNELDVVLEGTLHIKRIDVSPDDPRLPRHQHVFFPHHDAATVAFC